MTGQLVLIFAIIALLVVPAGAYEFQLVFEERIDGAEFYQSIDPIIDNDGGLVGFLYVEDLASNYLVLHRFDEDSLRRFEDTYMLPSAASYVIGDTVRAFVTNDETGYWGAYPPLYRVDFKPESTVVDSVDLGQSWCGMDNYCTLHCNASHLYWLEDAQGDRILACSMDYMESDQLMPSVSYIRTNSRTNLFDPEDLSDVWSAGVHRVGSGELAAIEGSEYAAVSNSSRQDFLMQEPLEERAYFSVTSSDLEAVYSVYNDDQKSTHVFVGDYVPAYAGDEIVYRGSMDAIRPDECDDEYYTACYRMVNDTPQVVWSLDESWEPVYVSETEGLLLMVHSGLLEVIDVATGLSLGQLDLPNLAHRNYFEAEGSMLHLAGRVHDTIRVYSLDLVTDVPGGSAPSVPVAFTLHQNYPNPFNPSTTIEYSLPTSCHVRLDILNLLGQTVRTLLDEVRTAGDHRVVWNGTDASGQRVASGVYLYRITTPQGSQSRQMLLLK